MPSLGMSRYPPFSKKFWCGIPTPLKNMSSSVGVIIPNLMESHKSHVPNHQPELDVRYDLSCIEMGPLVFFACHRNPNTSWLYLGSWSRSWVRLPYSTWDIHPYIYGEISPVTLVCVGTAPFYIVNIRYHIPTISHIPSG